MGELNEAEIPRKYDAAIHSVDLFSAGKPVTITQEDWADSVRRNVEHLKVMVGKDFWRNEDLTPLRDAIAAHGAHD